MTDFFNLGYLIEMLMPIIGIVALLDRHKYGIMKGGACVCIGATLDIIYIFLQLNSGREN